MYHWYSDSDTTFGFATKLQVLIHAVSDITNDSNSDLQYLGT